MGRERTRTLFAVMVGLPYALVLLIWLADLGSLTAWLLLSWLTIPLAIRLVRIVDRRTDGPSLNAALAGTGMLQLCFCVLLSAGLLLSR